VPFLWSGRTPTLCSRRRSAASLVGSRECPGSRQEILSFENSLKLLSVRISSRCTRRFTESQIALLKYANHVAAIGVVEAHARIPFDYAAASDAQFYANYSFENWIGFLTITRLLEKRDDRYLITLRGRAFLQFMVAQSLPDTGVANNAAH
jgi:hypothetical protein